MPFSSSLQETRSALSRLLHWPQNLGIEFRELSIGTQPTQSALALFVRGIANEELIRVMVMEPLARITATSPLTLDSLYAILPAPRLRAVGTLPAAIEGVLDGATALFLDGVLQCVLVETDKRVIYPAGSAVPMNPMKDVFSPDLTDNIALLRKRLRDPALIAESMPLPRERARSAALVYMKGRAEPAVMDQVTEWVLQRGGEEALRRGLAAGLPGTLGLLPDLMSSSWPDKVAALLDVGYVAVILDRLPFAFIAPVTAPAMLYSPSDENLRRPVSGLLKVLRAALGTFIIVAPGTVVALMNYHQEMLPTPFLLAMAATRENAAAPVVFEILGLEVLQEVIREAAFRLPSTITPGSALIAGNVMVLILVLSGLVGPLEAVVSMLVAFASLGLPSYESTYMNRILRFWAIIAAWIFGFFGIAFLLFLLVVYLMQHHSFGVPFIGETGLRFTAPGRLSSSRKGVSRHSSRPSVR